MSRSNPGPWVIDDRHGLVVGPCRIRYGVTAQQKNEAFANARLIAAAPDLLEALKGLAAIVDPDTIEFDNARAAIAKATGES